MTPLDKDCVSSTKTGKCLLHCFPQGDSKWRGSQVRRAIASVSIAWRAVAYANAVCGARPIIYLPRLQPCSSNLYSGCALQDVAMTLGLGTLISRRVLVPRHVSPRRVNENILHSCSKRAFTWRNEVTSVSVFNIVVACL